MAGSECDIEMFTCDLLCSLVVLSDCHSFYSFYFHILFVTYSSRIGKFYYFPTPFMFESSFFRKSQNVGTSIDP